MDGSRVKTLAARRKHLKAVVDKQRKHRATGLYGHMKSTSPKLAQCASAGTAALWKNDQRGPVAQTVKALRLYLLCGQAFCIIYSALRMVGAKKKSNLNGQLLVIRHTLA